jgi:hypothetical protein
MAKLPPIPPHNRSSKGTGEPVVPDNDQSPHPRFIANDREQGRQGNIHQNTTHQGYQQDR